MEEYTDGSLIAVFGGEFGKDSHSADTVTLCKVIIVGQDDLIVEHATSYSSSYYTVPKSICFKLSLDPEIVSSAKVLTPQIGDLVISFSQKYTGDNHTKISGILYKIIYKLGKEDKCTLLCGSEMVSVSWDTLMVLDRPKGK